MRLRCIDLRIHLLVLAVDERGRESSGWLGRVESWGGCVMTDD